MVLLENLFRVLRKCPVVKKETSLCPHAPERMLRKKVLMRESLKMSTFRV